MKSSVAERALVRTDVGAYAWRDDGREISPDVEGPRRTAPRPAARSMTERPLLLTLALGNFVLGTGAFVLPALLQPMAADLGVSLSAAGWLMSGYALAYALA